MIFFKTVRWRNMLSTGNQFTEVQLNRSLSTLIIGTNGAGKSTIIDSITFALYGKPFRNINKGQLVNSINRKELEVQIEFSIGTKEYKIIRGIKPNKFEIYIGEDLINQDAATKDYQDYLEENILKLNYKSFTQNSILASAQYIPFMQLPVASRREVIEDLLDISVFSKMNEVLKTRVSTFKTELVDIERNLELAKMKMDTQTKYVETLEKNTKDRVVQIETDIQSSIERIETQKSNITETHKLIESIDESELVVIREKIVKKNERHKKLKEIQDQLTNTKNEYTQELLEIAESPELVQINEEIKSNEELVVVLDNHLKDINATKTDTILEYRTLVSSNKLEDAKCSIVDCNKAIAEFISEKKQISYEKASIQKELSFFEENETCPTCTQPISKNFRESTISEKSIRIDEMVKKISEKDQHITNLSTKIVELEDICKTEIERLETERKVKLEDIDSHIGLKESEIDAIKTVINNLVAQYDNLKTEQNKDKKEYLDKLNESLLDVQGKISDTEIDITIMTKELNSKVLSIDSQKSSHIASISKYENSIESENQYIQRLENEKESILSKNDDLQKEIDKKNELEIDIYAFETQYNDKHIEKKYIDVAVSIMKDTGIKTSIIKKYIPIINKLINSYLQIMDLFVEYELDETFNEKIKSRHRDEFSYASFSEGEKARIDLAILFTFRSIAKMKSTSCTNLLLLDETFDGSIDSDGSDSISAILRTLQDTNVFCISHNEKMFDKFRSLIKFQKINNYSVIA